VLRLSLFYIFAIALVVAIVPWTKAGLSESPFVTVFRAVGIPYAAGIMNFVVLTAALSSMNTNLYLTGRMLFSLSRSGFAPKIFGTLSKEGSPRAAVLASTFGLLIAAFLSVKYPNSAYMYLFGISIFGGIFVWIMILYTFLQFRSKRMREGLPVGKIHMPGYPWLPWLGIIALFLILLDCFFIGLNIAWYAGIPWLIFISIMYLLNKNKIISAIEHEEKI